MLIPRYLLKEDVRVIFTLVENTKLPLLLLHLCFTPFYFNFRRPLVFPKHRAQLIPLIKRLMNRTPCNNRRSNVFTSKGTLLSAVFSIPFMSKPFVWQQVSFTRGPLLNVNPFLWDCGVPTGLISYV